MNDALLLDRLATALRNARQGRGLTQAKLATAARVSRRKVIEVEQGLGSVSMQCYARIASALGLEFNVIPAVRPTLDEIERVLERD